MRFSACGVASVRLFSVTSLFVLADAAFVSLAKREKKGGEQRQWAHNAIMLRQTQDENMRSGVANAAANAEWACRCY